MSHRERAPPKHHLFQDHTHCHYTVIAVKGTVKKKKNLAKLKTLKEAKKEAKGRKRAGGGGHGMVGAP